MILLRDLKDLISGYDRFYSGVNQTLLQGLIDLGASILFSGI